MFDFHFIFMLDDNLRDGRRIFRNGDTARRWEGDLRSVDASGRDTSLDLCSWGGLAGAQGNSLRTSSGSEGGRTTAFETSLNSLLLLHGKFAVTVLTKHHSVVSSRVRYIDHLWKRIELVRCDTSAFDA